MQTAAILAAFGAGLVWGAHFVVAIVVLVLLKTLFALLPATNR